MATKAKNNKNMIICICVAVVVVIAIILAIILIPKGQTINDAYFVSDDTKYVLTLDGDSLDSDSEYTPIKSHIVYTYSGDEITGLKAYYEFADSAAAKAAYDTYKDETVEGYNDISLDGKYIVMTADKSQYEGTTAAEVKQQIDFMEMLNSMNFDDTDTSSEEE